MNVEHPAPSQILDLHHELRQLPHIDQYLGPWAIREDAAQALLHRARTLDLHVHLRSQDAADAQQRGAVGAEYELVGNIAVVPIRGTLMKHESSFSRGTGTVNARRKIRAALNDPDVRSILLHIESPGGTAAGTKELADEVHAARQQKTVWAYAEDLCCSAAYWIASQAEQIFANAPALVGSIGTYMVIHDFARLFDDAGVKTHVIRAGDFKGAGTMGTEITEAQLGEFQRVVNQINDFFLSGVARGRGLNQKRVKELADGRVQMAADAKDLGLIDGVQTLDQTLSQLTKVKRMSTAKQESQEPVAITLGSTAASLQEIRVACPGCDDSFVVAQLEKDATVAQAQQAWTQALADRLKARDEELAQLKAEQAAEKPGDQPAPRPGVKALAEPKAKADTESGDPIARWNEAIAAEIKTGKTKAAAIRATVKADPELHQAYLAAVNAQAKPRR